MRLRSMSVSLAIALTAATGSAAAAKTYAIGAVAQGSLAYASAAAIAKLASEKSIGQIRVVPQGGPVVTLPLVSSGELDFSVGVSSVVVFAYKGQAMFKGRPQKNVRVIATLFPLRFGFFVKKDSPIKSIADLKGKRIGSEFRKQRIIELYIRATLGAYGLTYKDVRGVPAVNFAKNIQDFNVGRVDAAYAAIGSGLVAQSNAAVGGVRWLPVDDKPEILAGIRKFAPGVFIEEIKPAKHMVGVLQPMTVTTAPYVIVGNASLPEKFVYDLAKAIHTNKKDLAATFAAYRGFNPRNAARDLGVPYHPGAMKYFKEAGIWSQK